MSLIHNLYAVYKITLEVYFEILFYLQLLTTGSLTFTEKQLVDELEDLVQALGLNVQLHQQKPGMAADLQESGPNIQIEEPLQQPGPNVKEHGLGKEMQQHYQTRTGAVVGIKQEKMASRENAIDAELNLKARKDLLKHKNVMPQSKMDVDDGIVSVLDGGRFDLKKEKFVKLKENTLKELVVTNGFASEAGSFAPGVPEASAELILEEPVPAAWKLRRLTVRVKRVELNRPSSQKSETDQRDSETPIVFDDSDEETGSPSKAFAETETGGNNEGSKKEVETERKEFVGHLSTAKNRLEPVSILGHQRERQKFITRAIITGIR